MVNVLFQYTHLTKADPQLIVYIEYKKRGDFIMRIALINENSQAAKNEMIYASLKKVAESKGHTVDNYGMYSADDKAQLTYVQNGILAAILLNSGAADFVVTGCGTGEGAMLALNSFPGVLCGHVVDPSDAYMFMQINDGNAIAMVTLSLFHLQRASDGVQSLTSHTSLKSFSRVNQVADILKKELFLNRETRRFLMA